MILLLLKVLIILFQDFSNRIFELSTLFLYGWEMLSPDCFLSRLHIQIRYRRRAGHLVKRLSVFPEVFEFYEGESAASCYVNFAGGLKNLPATPTYDKTALIRSSHKE